MLFTVDYMPVYFEKPLNTLYATPRKSTFIAFIGRVQNHVDLRALKKFKFLCNESLFSICFKAGLL